MESSLPRIPSTGKHAEDIFLAGVLGVMVPQQKLEISSDKKHVCHYTLSSSWVHPHHLLLNCASLNHQYFVAKLHIHTIIVSISTKMPSLTHPNTVSSGPACPVQSWCRRPSCTPRNALGETKEDKFHKHCWWWGWRRSSTKYNFCQHSTIPFQSIPFTI